MKNDNKKKILMITTFYPPSKGGIQTYSYEIVKNLNNLGDEVTTLVISSNGIKKILSVNSFKVYKNNKKISFRSIFSRFDIILVSSWFPSAIFGVILSRLYSANLFISAHGNELLYPKKYPFMEKIMLWCFDNANKIFSVSNYTKKILINMGVENIKIVVIPNGTDPARFNPDISGEEILEKYKLKNKKIIFSVSRLVERKNFGIIIESMGEILKQFPNTVYLIGGEGLMKEKWMKLAKNKGFEDSVIFLGYIPDEELPKYYNISNVFVLPSKELKNEGEVEGFGISFLEANACGIPVIGGKSGGVEDAIIDGKTGVLIDPGNKEQIQKEIIKILRNPKFAKSLGINGRKRVLNELSWEKITYKIKEYIHDKVK